MSSYLSTVLYSRPSAPKKCIHVSLKCHSTWVRPESRGRGQCPSGMTVDSHPFFFCLHPFIVIENVDSDPLCFAFFHKRLFASPLDTQDRPCAHRRLVLRDWSTLTLDSTGRVCGCGPGSVFGTGFSCKFLQHHHESSTRNSSRWPRDLACDQGL